MLPVEVEEVLLGWLDEQRGIVSREDWLVEQIATNRRCLAMDDADLVEGLSAEALQKLRDIAGDTPTHEAVRFVMNLQILISEDLLNRLQPSRWN